MLRYALASFLMLTSFSVYADGGIPIQKQGGVSNVIVLDDKAVVRQTSPSEAGVRIGTKVQTQEEYAKEQAIENQLYQAVVPNRMPKIRGDMNNVIMTDTVYGSKRGSKAEACVEIGAIGGNSDCVSKNKK